VCRKCGGEGVVTAVFSSNGENPSKECNWCEGTGKAPTELPMSLMQWYLRTLPWYRVNPEGDDWNLPWETHPDNPEYREQNFTESALWSQVEFFRDEVGPMFRQRRPKEDPDAWLDYHEEWDNVMVINTHTSKSVLLPVVRVDLGDGQFMVVRNNWYNYQISMSLNSVFSAPLPRNIFMEGVDEDVHPVYCEGFPREMVFGRFGAGASQFTVTIGRKAKFITFLMHLRDWLEDQKEWGEVYRGVGEERKPFLEAARVALGHLSPAERRFLVSEYERVLGG